MSEKLTGEKLLKTAINQILKYPETWNQGVWHSSCGTKHCIAGWCQILSGNIPNNDLAKLQAQLALGISDDDANFLFRSNCTIQEAYYFAENFDLAGFDRAGFDRAGFDRAGFDRAGFDRAGFDRAGFHRAGFDRAGFDRAGFDLAGFDLAGFDRAGFDRAGFDRAGFDRAGFDRAGFDRAGFDRAGKKFTLFQL